MPTVPTQRSLRGSQPARSRPRIANSTEHQAALAARLTARDRWLLRMLHEHRVLTSQQITDLAFPSGRAARRRLLELFQWSVLDRFQPFTTHGAAPMHYVLAPAGAGVLAAEDGLDVKDLGYRRDRAFGIAYSLHLAHTIGINQWFTSLISHARHDPTTAVTAWWSETRVAAHFGDLVRPDAYGRWQADDRDIEFFLEYDTGTEALAVVTRKLHGYARLAEATGITTPLLIWLPTTRREAGARRALTRARADLDHPHRLPIATATADHDDATPADPIWLPLEATGAGARRALHQLPDARHRQNRPTPPPAAPQTTTAPTSPALALPPPHPRPPAPGIDTDTTPDRHRHGR
ncbi:hypothetical protein FHR81_003256 [Actinoalloteichus hoggarensis]|uniref:Uncharacterized protein n=1 Tax=Actinoalloteichus hoggarensis TaxID=1470176 RepID=A0A221W6Q7_9PSEU|nr:replication-relaxation family protein [Actinoalloteichus hoggarensis]ASO21612.1 hypothetical protein AHOG_19970 [Actinoalloteichus hoggarensis]MBB5922204.1 hypothetical protein [Actinoalloteichus hoggarensis]